MERTNTAANTYQPEIQTSSVHRVGKTQPRQLIVERHNPDAVALRVLRLFAHQPREEVIDYCDRLRNVYDVAYWSETYFNNRALFSDYYLTHRLPEEMQDWQVSLTQHSEERKLGSYLRDINRLYTLAADHQYEDTQQTLIFPILQLLGFAVETQPQSKRPKRDEHKQRQADYVLYLQDRTNPNKRLAKAAGFCLAYQWGRYLDGPDPQPANYDASRDEDHLLENPGAVVVALLDQDIADWGIVTNGQQWRLYYAKAHSRATNYYEINLNEITDDELPDPLAFFRYFWFIFRAEAFRPTETLDGGQTRISWLERIIKGSEFYAHELGEQLKTQIFVEIFPHFAQGFVEDARQRALYQQKLEQMDEHTREQTLREIFNGTLTFLYRLLFVLYAESRNLLPLYHKGEYYQYSLLQMKTQIKRIAKDSVDNAPNLIRQHYKNYSTELYDRLQILFRAIDQGNPALNMPVYNGGLFMTDPATNDTADEANIARFLRDHKIPDQYLAFGLNLLTRVEQKKGSNLVFVDYKSLGVRQLGSIYEGLLEFKLHVALEQMTVVPSGGKGRKTELIIPWQEAKEKKISPIKQRQNNTEKIYNIGEVYITNNSSERKTTGSYYTPDYIVKYIVEKAVGPLLDEKFAALEPAFRAVQETLSTNKAREIALSSKQQATPLHARAEHATYLQCRDKLNEPFFNLKVLDPAMGSGHFLVEAVDYITDRMTEFLQKFRWNPISYQLKLMREEIQREMDQQGLEIDSNKLTDINLLKRQVLKRCIYGVDINAMAVELAKVSVWLDSFTLGAPLSFLDHHLKCGNSLIGAWVKDARNLIEDTTTLQNTLFSESSLWASVALATGGALEVARLSDITASQVLLSKEKHRIAEVALLPYKRLLDIYVSRWFSNPATKNKKTRVIYDEAIYFLRSKEAEAWHKHLDQLHLLTREQQALVTRAASDATTHHFFHWEMEFPEVYFGVVAGTRDVIELKKDAGFDAVIGNPPYVRQEELGPSKPALEQLYTVYNSIADLYTYFIERSHKLLRSHGRFGMITANKFMRANYGAKLRSFLIEKVKLEQLIDFGDLPVFGEATTYPIIILSQQTSRNNASIRYALIKNLNEDLARTVESTLNEMPETAFGGTNWSLAPVSMQTIFDKISQNSISLGQYVEHKIFFGIKTGFNEAFVIDEKIREQLIAEDSKSVEIIKPFIIGEDARRYSINFQNRYLIWTYIGVPLDKYPSISRYLKQYQTYLEKRSDQGNHWWELRPCDYYTIFDSPKIIYPNICMQPEFAYDDKGYYSNQKTFIISSADLYLLALLNSKIMKFIFNMVLPKLRGGYFEPSYVFMKDVPIRSINYITSDKDRANYLNKAKQLYQQYISKNDRDSVYSKSDQDDVIGFVKHHLAQQPEASDIVHDLLAFLAEEMLRLNKEKQAEQKRFLSYLEKKLKIKEKDDKTGIDALVGKQEIMDYPGDYQKKKPELPYEELLAILKKNKGRFERPVEGFIADELRDEYRKSLAIVLPLKEQLCRTDGLIDYIVYELYGLTEDEIVVVEGNV